MTLVVGRIEIRSPAFRECKTFRLSDEVRVPSRKVSDLPGMSYFFKKDFTGEVAECEIVESVIRVTLKDDVFVDEGLYGRLAQELLVRLLKVVGQPWIIKPGVTTHL